MDWVISEQHGSVIVMRPDEEVMEWHRPLDEAKYLVDRYIDTGSLEGMSPEERAFMEGR